jgi:hypothetical protein
MECNKNVCMYVFQATPPAITYIEKRTRPLQKCQKNLLMITDAKVYKIWVYRRVLSIYF